MQRVRVKVSRLRRYGSDISFDVFGDLGDGSVDFDHALTARRMALWPDGVGPAGHLRDGHLTLRHLDSVAPDGHLEADHLETEHLQPAIGVGFESPLYVFGRFAHAVVMYDRAGNASAATTAAITVNSAPSVPQRVTRSGYDPGQDRITFSFEPSRFGAVRGV